MTLVPVLHVTWTEMLGNSQDTFQVLRQLEWFSPHFWGRSRSTAIGTSQSSSFWARTTLSTEIPEWVLQGGASLTLMSIPTPGIVMDFGSASVILAALSSSGTVMLADSVSRQVGMISFKVSRSSSISLDSILCDFLCWTQLPVLAIEGQELICLSSAVDISSHNGGKSLKT